MTKQYSYESVSIDKGLYNQVVRFIQEYDGYRTPSEFIHEAVRLRLGDLERMEIEKIRIAGAKELSKNAVVSHPR